MYPIEFQVGASANSDSPSWTTLSKHYQQELPVDIPKEFKGDGVGFSPEDFIGMAAANCFIATFKVFAKASRIVFESLSVQTKLTIEEVTKTPSITTMHFSICLGGVEKKDRAERLLQKVSQSCIVLNSLLAKKTFEFNISETTPTVVS